MLLWKALPRHRAVSLNALRQYSAAAAADPTSSWPSLAASRQLTHLKSTFQGYAASVSRSKLSESAHGGNEPAVMRADVVPGLLAHLRIVEPRTRRASHAMYAWRLRNHTSGTALAGSSNGGEAGAGERLERLLELSQCEDVIVVVFRWYGGVKLGSDRWRCISSVAKDALEEGGFLPSDGDSCKHAGPGHGPPTRKKR